MRASNPIIQLLARSANNVPCGYVTTPVICVAYNLYTLVGLLIAFLALAACITPSDIMKCTPWVVGTKRRFYTIDTFTIQLLYLWILENHRRGLEVNRQVHLLRDSDLYV